MKNLEPRSDCDLVTVPTRQGLEAVDILRRGALDAVGPVMTVGPVLHDDTCDTLGFLVPPGTADGGWLRAFHAVVPPLLREFKPTLLVTQHGCDSHMDDPLAHLMLSVDGQRAAHLALHDLAHEVCGGKWVATGGGGYSVVDVVPRTWSHLLAVIGGAPLDPQTEVPAEWRLHVTELTGHRAPTLMTDGRQALFNDWSSGYNPDSWLDRSIQATREAVFPLHGIDLHY